jgi:hypothetical protein
MTDNHKRKTDSAQKGYKKQKHDSPQPDSPPQTPKTILPSPYLQNAQTIAQSLYYSTTYLPDNKQATDMLQYIRTKGGQPGICISPYKAIEPNIVFNINNKGKLHIQKQPTPIWFLAEARFDIYPHSKAVAYAKGAMHRVEADIAFITDQHTITNLLTKFFAACQITETCTMYNNTEGEYTTISRTSCMYLEPTVYTISLTPS